MSPIARCIALLPLLFVALARPAHADPMDDFLITGNGLSIDFSVPASTTGPYNEIQGQFNLGAISGTINGANQTIDVNFVTATGCAECQSILIGYDSTSLALGIPPLYEITPAGGTDETFTFLPGTYMTGSISMPFFPYEIKVTPEAAATPEPPTFLLLFAAALSGMLLPRLRNLKQA